MTADRVKVLIVDDSALVRDILEKGLSSDPSIEVVGKAIDVYSARDKIVYKNPDVITLDVEMPGMNGVEFLKRLMPQYPLPVVMVSSLTEKNARITLEALEAGAIDFVLKPSARDKEGLKEMLLELLKKIKVAARTDVSNWKKDDFNIEKVKSSDIPNRMRENVIAIGASAGGTIATKKVISSLPKNTPGILIVQHMPAGFTTMYAKSLNDISDVNVKEAENGDRIEMGRVLVAPGNKHMSIKAKGAYYIVKITDGEKINGHRPSVDILFNSMAEQVGRNGLGVLLTGMGRDGADGLLKMRMAGAKTLAQDKASSVVFGMPGEAYKIGACDKLVDINRMAMEIINVLK